MKEATFPPRPNIKGKREMFGQGQRSNPSPPLGVLASQCKVLRRACFLFAPLEELCFIVQWSVNFFSALVSAMLFL